MPQEDERRPAGGFRPWPTVGVCVLLLAIGIGGLVFYRYQRAKNSARLLSQAQTARDAQDWQAASSSYRLYLQRNPDDTTSLRDYALTLIAWLDASPDVVRRSPRIVGEIIRTLRTLGRADPAQSLFTTRHLVRLYLLRGEYTAAEVQAEAWVRLDPEDTQAAVSLAQALIGLHRNDEAAAVLVAALERNRLAFEAYALLIELYDDHTLINDAVEAKRWLDAALQAGPDSRDVQMAAFRFYRRRIQAAPTPEETRRAIEAAERHLEKALTLANDDARVLVAAAYHYMATHDLDRSGSLLEEARRLAPVWHLVLQARAAWAIETGSRERMMDVAEEVRDAVGISDPALTALAAELLLRAGAHDRAEECLHTLRQTSLGDRRVQLWLDVLSGAHELFRHQPYRALPYLERAMRVRPGHLWTAELLAEAYVAVGDHGAAINVCRGVLLGREDEPILRVILAEAELLSGNIEIARREASRVVAEQGGVAKRASTVLAACDLAGDEGGSSSDAATSALAALQQRVTADPDDDRAVDLLATWYARHGRLPDTLSLLASQADAWKSRRTAERIADLLLAKGDSREARELADWLVGQFPGDAAGHALRARLLILDERFDEAIAYTEQSSLTGADAASLWLAVGESLLDAKRMASALTALRRAVQVETDHIPALIAMIRQTPDLPEGQSLIDRLRRAEGEDGLQWRYEQARFLLERSRATASAQRAAVLLTEVLAVRRTWLSARVLLAFAYETSQQLEEAADAYRAAIELSPELASDELALRLVNVLRKLGRFDEADGALAVLARGMEASPVVLRLQTESYLRQHKPAAAATAAEQLLALRHDDPAWAAATAELHLRAGNAPDAERVARASLEMHPDSTTALWSLSRALVAQGRPQEAESLVLDLATSKQSAHHYVVLAQLYRQMDRHVEADDAIERAAAAGADTAAISAACAHYWKMRGDRNRQILFTRRTVEQRGENPSESLALASLLAQGTSAEERTECGTIIERRLASHPEELQSLLLKAQLAATASPPAFEEATVALRRALTVDPRSAAAHKLLAGIQMQTDKLPEADETIAAGLTFAPTDVELLLAAGELNSHRGLYARAIPYLRRLLDLRPGDPQGLVLLATAFRKLGRLKDAIELVEAPRDDAVVTSIESSLLAELHEAGGDVELAQSIFEAALARDNGNTDLLRRFLRFKARRGSFEDIRSLAQAWRDEHTDVVPLIEAGAILGGRCTDTTLREVGLDWLRGIVDTDTTHAADAVFQAALCHYRCGEFDLAEPLLQRAIQLAPSSTQPVNALAWMYCEDLGRPDRAIQTIEQFLDRGGVEDNALLDTHGTVLLRLGRLTPARQKLVRCVARAGQNTTLTAATFHLGQTLVKDGDAREGHRYLRQALQLQASLGGLSPQDQATAGELLGQ